LNGSTDYNKPEKANMKKYEEITKHYRYLLITNNDDQDLVGAYNDLQYLIDQNWGSFDAFPERHVVIDTKDDTKFTLKVKY
jgi:hypothetical protein